MFAPRQLIDRLIRPWSRPPSGIDYPVLDKLRFTSDLGPDGSLRHLFHTHDGRPSSKWDHYLKIYEECLEPIRERVLREGRGVRLVEVGVAEGGSLEIWHKYFGPESRIVGVDISPQVSGLLDPDIKVVSGSQTDTTVLESCISLLGGSVDVVIDDGSHLGSDQIATFEYFWSRMEYGAIYLVEDLHTSYWSQFRGGPGRRGTFIEYAKMLVDDMHLTYHRRIRTRLAGVAATTIGSISFYDSIVAIVKERRPHPSRATSGMRTH
jgi:hypothetical protein